MIFVIADTLKPTASFRSRELRALVGGVWPDGRDATVILDLRPAAGRFDRAGVRRRSATSGYSVAEVREVGYANGQGIQVYNLGTVGNGMMHSATRVHDAAALIEALG